MAQPSSSNLRLTANGLNNTSKHEFVEFEATMRLPMAPLWASGGKASNGSGGPVEGVREVLTGWLMRYLPPLKGVLVSFNPSPSFEHPASQFNSAYSPFETPSASSSSRNDPSRLLMSPGREDEEEDAAPSQSVKLIAMPMIEGSGFALPVVRWNGVVWRPRVGQIVVGSPSLSTPSHISLLLHNLFNASIPASQIPDTYRFDPDFPVPESIRNRQKLTWETSGNEAVAVEEEIVEETIEGDEEEKDGALEVEKEMRKEIEEEEDLYREKGWWRHKVTDEPLGGTEGRIEFTIVGLTIANSMLSITGSLLPRPFAPFKVLSKRGASLPLSKKRRRANSDSSNSSSTSSVLSPAKTVPPTIEIATLEEREELSERAPKPKKEKKVKGEKNDKKERKDKESKKSSKKAKVKPEAD